MLDSKLRLANSKTKLVEATPYKRAGGANGVQAISVLSEKYVWRFDIAMNDALRVSRLKSAHNRDECGNREDEVSPDAGRVYRGQ